MSRRKRKWRSATEAELAAVHPQPEPDRSTPEAWHAVWADQAVRR